MVRLERRDVQQNVSIVLAALVFLVFSGTLSCGFVFDDGDYLIRNRIVHFGLSRAGILWAMKTTHMGNWHPLTWYSHMLDVELFDAKPWGHHLTNMLIHTANTLLLFQLMQLLTARVLVSAFVAALFAVHPFHVESVAWVSERKGLLCAFFWILAMLAYVSFVKEKVESPKKARWIFFLAILLFMCALMSKPMAVTFPFVLVLLDYWPLGITKPGIRGWMRQILEKRVFILLSIASCFVTVVAQGKTGALTSGAKFTVGERFANAVVSYVLYLYKTVWPVGLGGYYPHTARRLELWQPIVCTLVLLVISMSTIYLARAGKRYAVVGWFWYLGTLVPVIGIIQVGWQAMADRYTYLPLIGLFIMLVFGASDVVERWRQRCRTHSLYVPRLAVLIVIAALSFCAWVQVSFWRNQESFWKRAIAVTKGNYIAHYNLGCFLANTDRADEALEHFRAAVRAAPDYAEAHNNLGVLLASRGDTNEARVHYMRAIELDGKYVDPRVNLGNLLADEGKLYQAMECYRAALSIAPNDADANFGMGETLSRLKKYPQALAYYRTATKVRPNYLEAHEALARALYNMGSYADAWKEIERVEDLGGSVDAELLSRMEAAMPRRVK